METHINISVPSSVDRKMSFKEHSNVLKQRGLLTTKKHWFKSQKKIIIFIVDDDILHLKALEHSIVNNVDKVKVYAFQTGEECLQNMKLNPTIVILDYYLNSQMPLARNGMNILKRIKTSNPASKVIILSSQDSLTIAIDCVENGAYDYISKSRPSFVRINNIIKNIIENKEANSSFYETGQFVVVLIIILAIIAGFLVNH